MPHGSKSLEASLAKGVRRVQLRAPHCRPRAGHRWSMPRSMRVAGMARTSWSTATSRSHRHSDIGVHLRSAQLAALDARPLAEGTSRRCVVPYRSTICGGPKHRLRFRRAGPVAQTPTHPDANAARAGMVRRVARGHLATDLCDRRDGGRRHRASRARMARRASRRSAGCGISD